MLKLFFSKAASYKVEIEAFNLVFSKKSLVALIDINVLLETVVSYAF